MFMHSTHNDGTSIVAKRFIQTLKGKNNEKVTGNDSKSHLVYLNGLVDNNYHRPISKKSVDVGCSRLKLNRVIRQVNWELVIESRLLSTRVDLNDKFVDLDG